MFESKSRLPLAAGLFGDDHIPPDRHTSPSGLDEMPDIESFENNYARELLRRAVAFTAHIDEDRELAA